MPSEGVFRPMGLFLGAFVGALILLGLTGCASGGERGSSISPGQRLPHAVTVAGANGKNFHIHIAPLVEAGRLSSPFGRRGHAMGGGSVGRHLGIDIVAPKGTPIRASAAGTVADLGTRGGYGRFVLIRHAGGLETAYAHLARYAARLKVGQSVEQGQVIGYVGSTGKSDGPHLHFELRKDGKAVDPLSFPAGRR